jgi:predicted amidophosphoribosyltransferase
MICKKCKNEDIGKRDNYCKICGTKLDKEVVKYFEEIKSNDNYVVGHVCKCGKEHMWPSYVFAHYHELLTHECGCGIKTILQDGKVEAR